MDRGRRIIVDEFIEEEQDKLPRFPYSRRVVSQMHDLAVAQVNMLSATYHIDTDVSSSKYGETEHSLYTYLVKTGLLEVLVDEAMYQANKWKKYDKDAIKTLIKYEQHSCNIDYLMGWTLTMQRFAFWQYHNLCWVYGFQPDPLLCNGIAMKYDKEASAWE